MESIKHNFGGSIVKDWTFLELVEAKLYIVNDIYE